MSFFSLKKFFFYCFLLCSISRASDDHRKFFMQKLINSNNPFVKPMSTTFNNSNKNFTSWECVESNDDSKEWYPGWKKKNDKNYILRCRIYDDILSKRYYLQVFKSAILKSNNQNDVTVEIEKYDTEKMRVLFNGEDGIIPELCQPMKIYNINGSRVFSSEKLLGLQFNTYSYSSSDPLKGINYPIAPQFIYLIGCSDKILSINESNKSHTAYCKQGNTVAKNTRKKWYESNSFYQSILCDLSEGKNEQTKYECYDELRESISITSFLLTHGEGKKYGNNILSSFSAVFTDEKGEVKNKILQICLAFYYSKTKKVYGKGALMGLFNKIKNQLGEDVEDFSFGIPSCSYYTNYGSLDKEDKQRFDASTAGMLYPKKNEFIGEIMKKKFASKNVKEISNSIKKNKDLGSFKKLFISLFEVLFSSENFLKSLGWCISIFFCGTVSYKLALAFVDYFNLGENKVDPLLRRLNSDTIRFYIYFRNVPLLGYMLRHLAIFLNDGKLLCDSPLRNPNGLKPIFNRDISKQMNGFYKKVKNRYFSKFFKMGNLVIYGETGTGKSEMARFLGGKFLNENIVSVIDILNGADFKAMSPSQLAIFLRSYLKYVDAIYLITKKPVILIIEEGGIALENKFNALRSSFLELMDANNEHANKMIFIITTNMERQDPDNPNKLALDPAALGRCDVIALSKPSDQERKNVIKGMIRKRVLRGILPIRSKKMEKKLLNMLMRKNKNGQYFYCHYGNFRTVNELLNVLENLFIRNPNCSMQEVKDCCISYKTIKRKGKRGKKRDIKKKRRLILG